MKQCTLGYHYLSIGNWNACNYKTKKNRCPRGFMCNDAPGYCCRRKLFILPGVIQNETSTKMLDLHKSVHLIFIFYFL